MINLINDDCLKILPTIADKSIDMVLCDLPYGVTQNKADIIIPFEKLWKEYKRIIKDNGCIALFAQGLFYIDLVNSCPSLFRYDIIWDKCLTSGFLNAKRMPLRRHEQIAIFYKKQPKYNPQMSVGKPLHGRGNAYKNKENKNNNYGAFSTTEDIRKGSTEKYPSSIIAFPKPHPSKALHPTEKSVECCKWLIQTFTDYGETVLDNCMGVGTTGVACQQTNRNFIGIEKDKNHFYLSQKRIQI